MQEKLQLIRRGFNSSIAFIVVFIVLFSLSKILTLLFKSLQNSLATSYQILLTEQDIVFIRECFYYSLFGLILPWIILVFISPFQPFINVFLSHRWHEYWIVSCDRKAIAYANIDSQRYYSMLNRIYVKLAYRRQGIGSCFILKIVQNITKPIFVFPLPTQQAQEFYTSLGFIRAFDDEIPERLGRYRSLWVLR